MKKISALAIAGLFTASLAATAMADMADVKVGGEVRLRDEWKNNYADFNKDAGDGYNMLAQRTRVNVDAKIDEKTKAFVQVQNNKNWGDAATSVVLQEGYVVLDKLFDQPLFFKAGRQKIALGNQRLVGLNDWGAGQSFDAWILGYNHDAFSAALFAVTAADFNSTTTKTNGYVNGLYVGVKNIPMNTLDVYAIQKLGVANANESFLTYGARLNGKAMNIDWDAELALQSGDSSKTGTTTITKSANAYWLTAGYTIPEAAKLRIGAEYDQLSGQDSSTDDKSFDHLFPTKHSTSRQHSVYGITDLVETVFNANSYTNPLGGRGLKSFSINVSAEPVEGLQLLAEYWNHSTAQDYVSGKTSIGSEINLQAWYAVSKNTSLHAYYAQLTPTSDLTDTYFTAGKSDAATDAVLQLQVNF